MNGIDPPITHVAIAGYTVKSARAHLSRVRNAVALAALSSRWFVSCFLPTFNNLFLCSRISTHSEFAFTCEQASVDLDVLPQTLLQPLPANVRVASVDPVTPYARQANRAFEY